MVVQVFHVGHSRRAVLDGVLGIEFCSVLSKVLPTLRARQCAHKAQDQGSKGLRVITELRRCVKVEPEGRAPYRLFGRLGLACHMFAYKLSDLRRSFAWVLPRVFLPEEHFQRSVGGASGLCSRRKSLDSSALMGWMSRR